MLLMASPEKSDRQISEAAQVSPTTVGKIRKSTVHPGQLKKRVGADGKSRRQPTKKPSAKKSKPAAASQPDREPHSTEPSAKASDHALAQFRIAVTTWFAKMTQDDRLKAVELVLKYKGVKVS